MNPPRFLTDEDFKKAIVTGALRREPRIEFFSVRGTRVEGRPDPEVLQYAADEELILLTHDVNTMPGHATDRLNAGLSFPGLFLVRQRVPVLMAINNILTIWADSNVGQWRDRVEFFPVKRTR